MKKSFILSCLLLSACSDVPLNQNADTLIQNYHDRQNTATTAQKDSYYYLLGIGASDEPLQAGRVYSDELQALLKQNASEDDILALNKRHPVHEIAIDEETNDDNTGLFCRYNSNSGQTAHACFESVLTQKFDTAKYKTAHDRYHTFLKNPPAIMQGNYHLKMHVPYYEITLKGQRLHFVHLLNTQNPDNVMQGLLDELSSLRAYLANANNLIEKNVYVNMIANQIQTIVLYHSHNPTIKPTLTPLTADELSFKTAIIGEFMGAYYLFNRLQNDVDMTLLYKKNKSINDMADTFTEQIQIGDLSAPEFATYYNNYEPKKRKIDPTNFIGKTLTDIGEQDYRSYIAKVKSLDNLITIANHHINGTPLNNVFAPTLTGSVIEKTHICLQNPVSNDRVATETKKRDEKFECLNL
ncbi:hypothetical protein [Moraxella equi]|uniref:Lipoprotein n=1 Tax=Moraxella equi TaxID=60442 RepID=A0A378QSV7_9GAMM|nr:hypothetical protein [Moraxella equi]OPH40225.1 hypothetical protein B5J93_00150 [Moraxella equi]STZ03761.1 Uncharacterised protein [Moraxella equi]